MSLVAPWLLAVALVGQLAGQQAAAAFDRVLAGDVPTRLALAQSLTHRRDAGSFFELWLLSYDPRPEVVAAAAAAAVGRCDGPFGEPCDVCVAGLQFFLPPPVPSELGDVSDAADAPAVLQTREALLRRRPALAVQGAPVAVKLTAIVSATARLGHPAALPEAAALLRLLAEDPNPEVQQAAGAALMTLDR